MAWLEAHAGAAPLSEAVPGGSGGANAIDNIQGKENRGHGNDKLTYADDHENNGLTETTPPASADHADGQGMFGTLQAMGTLPGRKGEDAIGSVLDASARMNGDDELAEELWRKMDEVTQRIYRTVADRTKTRLSEV